MKFNTALSSPRLDCARQIKDKHTRLRMQSTKSVKREMSKWVSFVIRLEDHRSDKANVGDSKNVKSIFHLWHENSSLGFASVEWLSCKNCSRSGPLNNCMVFNFSFSSPRSPSTHVSHAFLDRFFFMLFFFFCFVLLANEFLHLFHIFCAQIVCEKHSVCLLLLICAVWEPVNQSTRRENCCLFCCATNDYLVSQFVWMFPGNFF